MVVGLVLVDSFAKVIPKLMGAQRPAYRSLLTQPITGLTTQTWRQLTLMPVRISCSMHRSSGECRSSFSQNVVPSTYRLSCHPVSHPRLEQTWKAAQDYLAP